MRRRTAAEQIELQRRQSDAYRLIAEAKAAIPHNCRTCPNLQEEKGKLRCYVLAEFVEDCAIWRIQKLGRSVG